MLRVDDASKRTTGRDRVVERGLCKQSVGAISVVSEGPQVKSSGNSVGLSSSWRGAISDHQNMLDDVGTVMLAVTRALIDGQNPNTFTSIKQALGERS